jgi:hypothetical protein
MRFGRHKKRAFTFYVVLKVFNLGHFHPFTKSLDSLTHLLEICDCLGNSL